MDANGINFVGIVTSLVSGGLAGGSMGVLFNRLAYRRQLRTKLYPTVKDAYASYLIRMEKRYGRYWTQFVGDEPSSDDAPFVHRRSDLISTLVEFNELSEATILRKALVDNSVKAEHEKGAVFKLDLKPEAEALKVCLEKLHMKLKL